MRSRGFTFAAAALVVTSAGPSLPASAAAPAPARTAAPGLTNTATFGTPGGEEIPAHLIDMIKGAAAGSTITFTAYRFENRPVADALLDAARSRGVKVRLLVDGGAPETDGQQFGYVQRALADDGDDATWARYCRQILGAPPYHSCQGTGTMHNKFVLFSDTMGASDVVSTGSANLNTTSGRNTWNSWYTHVGNADLYQRFAGYFDDMAKMTADLNYYDTNPPEITGNIKSYFYPRARVPGDLSANDTFVHTLDATSCPGTIRVANWSLTRSPVAEALVQKVAEGCDVDIVARKIHEAACVPLATAVENGVEDGGRVRMWSYRQEDGEAPNYVHTKDVMIEAGYPNTDEPARVVFTGTGNLNRPSLEKNDENVIRIMNDHLTYQGFVANFDRIRNHVDGSGQGFRVESVEDCERTWEDKD
ncbi:phosphatidylserine/phosphatidylglycerophosphate/cardiolipin synthase family protein [Actinomadura sp. WMMB 499]|uniref:phospholipase D-like domain-containing protein n=1 Tax=Actinomadura sp. WMMB 499 TaxID=1219491 RepID=UPI0012482807|nr:phospholipase D-like domain-containing protein [Actinomadura sp. WMMB 499]QFG22612.1 hypothetical protein F7P10_17300 [Actinomadura sp. WMMB 499]